MGKGDRVVVYMPMIPEAVITMLACARLGAVHSVVFGGFAPHELAMRIDDVAADGGRDGVVRDRADPHRRVQAHARRCDRGAHTRHGTASSSNARAHALCTWSTAATSTGSELMAAAEPVDAVPVAATDPLYVLYTSGTTGKPKGIVRDNGGHAVALLWTMRNIYDIGPGDVFWAASDVGWVVGPLLHRLRAAAGRARRPCCTRASRSARPIPARSGG